MLIPLAALQCTTMGIRWQREIKYGVPITNELSEGEFPRVMRALYAATVDEEEPLWVSVSREKLHTLYDYSPSLKAIEPKLEPLMDAWSAYGRSETNHNAHEVENGWFFWCLRDAAAGAGYYESLEKSQQFWKQVADELEDAEAVGKIKTRWTMPSALMPPWREGTGERLLNALVKIPGFVASFKGTDSAFVFSEGRMGREVNRFEAITSNNAVCATDESFYTDGVRALETQNRIAHLYQRIWGIVAVLAGVSAVSVLVLLFCGRNTDVCLRENVWAMLGMAGALLVLFGGVAYNHAESCFSISVLYLSASYPLMITLELVCVHACAEGIVRMKKQTEKAKNQGKAKKIR